ncbi:MAG: Asp-tRNA(Asn)/Glu-tRNA(Gln) amidotransferase subunit GatC [Candidatus Kapaibacterium sp.]
MTNHEKILKTARLAALEFNSDEIDQFAREFDELIEFVSKLDEADVSGIEPMILPIDGIDKLRDDIPRAGQDSVNPAAISENFDNNYIKIKKEK